MRTKLFLCFLVLIPQWIFSQNTKPSRIDSIEQALALAKTDTEKVRLLDHLAYALSRLDYKKGIVYGEQAAKLAARKGWTKSAASADLALALCFSTKCDYAIASRHYAEAEKQYTALNNKEGLSSVYANWALMYMAQSDYGKALEYNFKALSIFEDLGFVQKQAIVLENIGTAYLEQGKHGKALDYYSQAMKNYKSCGDSDGMARNLANQGIILNNQGHYEKALRYHVQAMRINESKEDWSSLQTNYANIGITYSFLQNYQKALDYHLKALRLSERLNDTKNLAINLGNTGEVYFLIAEKNSEALARKQNLVLAIQYLQKAVGICRKIQFYGPCIEFCDYLYKAHYLAGDFKSALSAYKEYTTVRDTVYTADTRLKIADIEAKRAIELKNKDLTLKDRQLEIEKLKLINRNHERLLFSAAILLLFVFIFWLYNLFRRRARRHKKVLSDIAYIQSHQVRAPLARILGLAQLFDRQNPAAEINQQVVTMMHQSALELDQVVRSTVNKASEQS